MDPLETVGQDVIQVPEGYNAAKSVGDLITTEGNEKVAEKSLMEEVGDTLPQQEINNREPEMFDVDTTMDTTIEEDDDPPDSTDHSHRVG